VPAPRKPCEKCSFPALPGCRFCATHKAEALKALQEKLGSPIPYGPHPHHEEERGRHRGLSNEAIGGTPDQWPEGE
jgi:hypothetical protein